MSNPLYQNVYDEIRANQALLHDAVLPSIQELSNNLEALRNTVRQAQKEDGRKLKESERKFLHFLGAVGDVINNPEKYAQD